MHPEDAPAERPRPRPRRRRRRDGARTKWLRRGFAALVVVLFAWALAGLFAMLSAARSADEGIAAMQRARQATGSVPALVRALGATTDRPSITGAPTTLAPGGGTADLTDPLGDGDSGLGVGTDGTDETVVDDTVDAPTATGVPLGARGAARELRAATDDFHAAADHAGSTWLAPLRVMPVLGRQLRAVEAMADAAAGATSDAAEALDDLVGQLQDDTGGVEARLDAARRAKVTLDELRADLSGLDLGPSEGLMKPVGDARDRFVEERDTLDETLERATTGLDGVISFLQGPRRYLLLAANNAEMRAGSGMYLAAGELGVADGRFELGDVVATEPLQQPAPVTAMDPDVATLWGWMSPDREMRNVNATPRFEESARMAADIWRASTGSEVDGVLALDVRGLKDLLRVVGPVQVDTPDGPLTVSATSVDRSLLVDQYRRFTDQEERRDLMGDVAAAVFTAFNERPWSAAQLVGALEASGAGRNLLLWSRDPVEEAAWEALGASGRVPADAVLLSVLSRGGNKLDQFLDVRATMTWGPVPGEPDLRRMNVEVQIANTAPERLPRYIEGPYPGLDLQPGEYRGVLALTVPGGAGNPTMTGAELSLSGDDGPARTIGGQVQLQRGTTSTVTITFDLPREWEEITVLPSARVPHTRWVVDGQELNPRRPVEVELGVAR